MAHGHSRVALLSMCALAAVGRSKHMKQYTRWNVLLVAVNRLAPGLVQTESVFLSSVVTVLAFQHGATDHTKRRLLERYHGLTPLVFLVLDLIFHVTPALLSLSRAKDRPLRLSHVLTVYSWIATYYATVAGGLDCTAQYTRYPWKRQVAAVALGTPLFAAAWNHSRGLLFVLGAFYIKEWYDLTDSIRQQTESKQLEISNNAHDRDCHTKTTR